MHPNHFAEAIEATAGVHAYQVTQQEHAIDIAIVAPSREESDVSSAVTGQSCAALSRSTWLRHRFVSELSTRSADPTQRLASSSSCERALESTRGRVANHNPT